LIAERLAERVLSEYSTSSEVVVNDNQFVSNEDGRHENPKDYSYLDQLLKDNS
jgi:hypothetical protein